MHLKNKIINRLKIESKNLTHGAVKLLVFLAKFCDDTGLITGVHYKDFCNVTGMCTQSFYNAKKKLCDLEFIECYKRHGSDIDFRILDNSILTIEERKEGYVPFDIEFFHNKEIWNLTDNALILSLEFLKNSGANRSVKSGKSGSYRKNYEDFLDEFSGVKENGFGVTKVQLRSYIRSLKKFFIIGIKDGILYVTPPKSLVCKFRTKILTSCEKELAFRAADVVLRRFNLKFCKKKEKAAKVRRELVELFLQYKNYAIAILGKPDGRGENKSKVQFGFIIDAMQKAVALTLNVADAITQEDFFAGNIKFLHKNLRKVLNLA